MHLLSSFARYREYLLPVAIIACVGVILVPLPAFAMDLLLLANITIAIVILLTTLHVRTPLELSVFPSLLVVTTLGRLVLNIATTRLILTKAGTDSEGAAGRMICAFGDFVAGDVLLVGVVIFAIVVLIQFLVITKGATRVSEVAARFALDGMPGKQMAIDADLTSGSINEAEAKRQREELTRQADFYSAMDGATKFVRGDAIAGIAITTVNIVVGLYMGVVVSKMPLDRAGEVYTKLTIGDGLVSQIPAFLIALATALLVTRSTQQENLPDKFIKQIAAKPESLLIAGVFLTLLVVTGLPKIPLLILGGACIGLSWLISRDSASKQEKEKQPVKPTPPVQRAAPKPEDHLSVDAIRVEIGVGLLPVADPSRGGDLMECISSVRSKLAAEMGFLLPKVRLKDNLGLAHGGYQIHVGGNLVESGEALPGEMLVVETPNCDPGFLDQVEQVGRQLFAASGFGNRAAAWISEEDRENAIAAGCEVHSVSEAIAAHVEQAARRHAPELLTRDATQHLINQLQQKSPTVVSELIPGQLKLAQVQAVLKRLLAEDIPVVQLELIFEALGDHSTRIQEPGTLTEKVRTRLSRTISQRFSRMGEISALVLDQRIEEQLMASLDQPQVFAGDFGSARTHGAQQEYSEETEQLTEQILLQLQHWRAAQPCPILLVRPRLRPFLVDLLHQRLPQLRVLSYSEITLETRVTSIVVGPSPMAA